MLTGLVTVLLLAVPITSAHGTVTFSAPYTGFSVTPANYTSVTGCAAMHNPTPATWNSSTGSLQSSASVFAGKCKQYNYAQVYSAIEFTSPLFSAPVAGYWYAYVTVDAAFSAKASLSLSGPGNASNGTYVYGESYVYLSVATFIYDATHHNDTLIGYGTDALVSQYFTSNGTFSLSTSMTTSYVLVTGQFTGGHVYIAYTEITASIFADTYGGGSSASASLDVAGSNGLTIPSILIA